MLLGAMAAPLAVSSPTKTRPTAPANCGYSIVEFGKAINCVGDTIQLVKRYGVQVRADS